MAIVDTSIWIDVLRDATLRERAALFEALGDDEVILTRLTELELLQGALDEREWTVLHEALTTQVYAEASASTWSDAARIYFDLRRVGRTVRSPIDCLIAQIAMERGEVLLHRDRDFEEIAAIRPLRQIRVPRATAHP